MTTIVCTKEDFYKAYHDFRKVMCSTRSTQDMVGNGWKGLVLHYFGMQEVTDADIERCAMLIEATGHEALFRGWTLETPDLSRQD